MSSSSVEEDGVSLGGVVGVEDLDLAGICFDGDA